MTNPGPVERLSISTYGGGATAQHWTLNLDGDWIGDTSVPERAERWRAFITELEQREAAVGELTGALEQALWDADHTDHHTLAPATVARLRNALAAFKEKE